MATIVKCPEGTYRVQIRRKGQRALSATFTKRQDAADWANKTEAALIEGRLFPERVKHTVAEAIDRYLREVLPYHKPGTAVKKRQILAWWNERLGSLYLSSVRPSTIIEALHPTGLAPATRNAYYSHFASVFTVATRKWEWIQHCPRADRFKVPKCRIRILRPEERKRLLEQCKVSRSNHLYTVVVLALTTGARYREILRLHWDDIDFNRGLITLWKTKNGRVRSVPMVPQNEKVLKEHYETWVRRSTYSLVISRETGIKIVLVIF